MRPGAAAHRGTAIFEFILVTPILVGAMVLLIGLGKAVELKQQSLMAARYTAFMRMYSASAPDSNAVATAVRTGEGTWSVQAAGISDAGALSGAGFIGDMAKFVLDSMLGKSGSESGIRASANYTSSGFSVLKLGRASSAQYEVASNSWTNDECQVLIPFLLEKLHLAAIGKLLGF